VVFVKKTNLSVVNHKSKLSKQHKNLLFVHRTPNMSFLYHNASSLKKNSEYFDFVCYFFNFFIGAGADEPEFRFEFS
jgi:hypothetical protein